MSQKNPIKCELTGSYILMEKLLVTMIPKILQVRMRDIYSRMCTRTYTYKNQTPIKNSSNPVTSNGTEYGEKKE